MNSLSFVALSSDHFSLLHKWMQEPHVLQWWGEGKTWSFEEIQKKYHSYTLGYKIEQGMEKPIFPFIIYFKEQPIGFIQFYNAFDHEMGYKVEEIWANSSKSLAAIDFYIGDTQHIGKGLGAEVLKSFLHQYVFPSFAACLVDPEKNNKIAIKTYAKAGFTTLQEQASSIIMIANREEKKNPLIIFGSSRGDGNTLNAIKAAIKDRPIPIVDLQELDIAHYDYNYANSHDDFIPLAEKMVRHNPIILATPVYWYSMSALMKTFIDRWSDLLDIRKDIGRRLTNKELYVITSFGESMPRGFEDAFSQTCDYLDMQYKGCFYFYSGNDDLELKKTNEITADRFFTEIFN